MRHFLDSQNVHEVQATLRIRSPPGYLVHELRNDVHGRQRMLVMMRDWYRQIPNPEYFDVEGLTAQFLSAYTYDGGDLVDIPYALQFAEDINSGGRLLADWPLRGKERGAVPYQVAMAEEAASYYAHDPNTTSQSGTLAVWHEPYPRRSPVAHAPSGARKLWHGQPDPRYNPRAYNGSPRYNPSVVGGAQTRTVSDRRVATAFNPEGFASHPRRAERFGDPGPYPTAPHYSQSVGGVSAPLYREPPPKYSDGRMCARKVDPEVNCGTPRAHVSGLEDDWIFFTLEPEILHDVQLTLNRHYDKYSRCSGRQSSQRQVKVELELSDSQPNRMPMRLPNARATSDCGNKRVGTEALYYSSDPLSNGSSYCGDQFEYV